MPYDLLYSTNLSGYGAAMASAPGPHAAWCTGRTLAHVRSEWHDRAGLRDLAGYPKAVLALGYYAWLERRLHRRVDTLIAEDVATYEALRRAGGPVRLMHTGVDTGHFRPDADRRRATRAALAIPLDADVLVMAATINRQKGIALGVEAFRRLAVARPRLYLVVLGDGPERRRLEAVARDTAGGARVRFAGVVPDWDMARYYAAADILLYPTFRAEGAARDRRAMITGFGVATIARCATAVTTETRGPAPRRADLSQGVASLLDDPGVACLSATGGVRRRPRGLRASAPSPRCGHVGGQGLSPWTR